MLRKLAVPVVALGLTGAAVYYSPCLTGDCGEAAVAEADEESTPCAGHEGALAAGEEEEPCPYADGEEPCDEPCDGKKEGADAPDPSALAAAGEDEEPCPYAAGKKKGDEPCHGDGKADHSTLAAADPQPEQKAPPAPADGSRS